MLLWFIFIAREARPKTTKEWRWCFHETIGSWRFERLFGTKRPSGSLYDKPFLYYKSLHHLLGAFRLVPDREPTRESIALLLRYCADLPEVQRAIPALVREHSRSPYACAYMAILKCRTGDKKGALAWYERALTLVADTDPHFRQLMGLDEELGLRRADTVEAALAGRGTTCSTPGALPDPERPADRHLPSEGESAHLARAEVHADGTDALDREPLHGGER